MPRTPWTPCVRSKGWTAYAMWRCSAAACTARGTMWRAPARGGARGGGARARGGGYRRTRAICIKELHHITRDARSLALALALPVLMLLLFGFALSLDVDHIPTMI